MKNKMHFYFILSSENDAYLKQIKVILSTVKKNRVISLVTDTTYIFSLQPNEAVSTIKSFFPKDLECIVLV